MLPGTVLYVVGSDAVSTAVAQRRIPWALVFVLVAVAALLTVLVREARKKLREKEGRDARI
jgi:membrane protein implicated in regulation of membrane protease activity